MYIEFGPRLTSPPPVLCNEAVLYAFQVKADWNALLNLCSKVFAKPANANYPVSTCRPIDDWILLIFGKIRKVQNPEIPAGVSEVQALVQLPVYFKCGEREVWAYFTPYIWVDNPLSMTCGREVFGYPKGLGCFVVPDAIPSSGLKLSLKTWRGDLADQPVWPPDEEQMIVEQMGLLYPDGTVIDRWMSNLSSEKSRDMLRRWLQGRMNEIFYRQLRDVRSSVMKDISCFEQIVQADYNANIFQDPRKGRFSFTIANYDSAPMVNELGHSQLVYDPHSKIGTQELQDMVLMKASTIRLDNPRVIWESR
jgi:hypothetical protein